MSTQHHNAEYKRAERINVQQNPSGPQLVEHTALSTDICPENNF
jgi:hypothetical protein